MKISKQDLIDAFRIFGVERTDDDGYIISFRGPGDDGAEVYHHCYINSNGEEILDLEDTLDYIKSHDPETSAKMRRHFNKKAEGA